MRKTLIVPFVCIALTVPCGATAGERMIDLVRQGYQLVATEPYLSFEGCEFDKEIPIGGRVFRCQTYEYVYHCGKAEVLGARLSCKASRSRQPICARARITACGARWCPFRARTMDTAIVSLGFPRPLWSSKGD
jgi:hypothetical protein